MKKQSLILLASVGLIEETKSLILLALLDCIVRMFEHASRLQQGVGGFLGKPWGIPSVFKVGSVGIL